MPYSCVTQILSRSNHHPRKPSSCSFPFSPSLCLSPLPCGTTDRRFSPQINFLSSRTSYKWNDTAWLFCLKVCFSQHNFVAYWYFVCISRSFFFLSCWVVFLAQDSQADLILSLPQPWNQLFLLGMVLELRVCCSKKVYSSFLVKFSIISSIFLNIF